MDEEWTPAEIALYEYVEEVGQDNLASCFMKLELGIATPYEQMAMATFMGFMRDIISEFGGYSND